LQITKLSAIERLKALVQFVRSSTLRRFDEQKAGQWPGFWVWMSCLRVDTSVLVQINLGPSRASGSGGIYYAANAAFHTAGAVLSLRRNARRSNWPLWIRRSSSTPAMVIAAVLNHLNPSIGPMRSFTPR
jgi:hypothetical protein